MEMLQWWYLIFELPFIAALIFVLLQAVGASHTGQGDAPEVGHDLDQGVEMDAHDLGHDGDIAHDHGAADQSHEGHVLLRSLSLLGVGKVPLSLLLMSFCFIWGFSGWASNQLLSTVLPPSLFIWPSLAIALVSSIALTRLMAEGLSKLIPTTESYGTSPLQLLGKTATARYSISSTSGSACLYDEYGHFTEVPCLTLEGDEPIADGESVVLVRYDLERHVFLVCRNPESRRLSDLEPNRIVSLEDTDQERRTVHGNSREKA
jgi:hypothetical protein